MQFCAVTAAQTAADQRQRPFDADWRFNKDTINGAEDPAYDDSKWRTVDLPHDWSIEKLPNQIPDSIIGPFSKAAINGRDMGFLTGGTGWYRKTFKLNETSREKSVYINFDGVYMNSVVWINGHFLGNHLTGIRRFIMTLHLT